MKIVVCDDHRLLLESLATALAGHGCQVEAAVTTPADAVRAVATHDPDVLLIDVTFPEGSGIDAARQVVHQHPRTKVVMITGEEAPEPLRAALDAGVSGYLRKGQRVEAVLAALHTALGGELAVERELLHQVRRDVPSLPRQRTPLDGLTPRELRVLHLLVDGRSTSEMVRQLGVSQSTVRTHVQNILAKLGVHSRLQAVALLTREGDLERVLD